MSRTYTLGELASLAGVTRDVAEGWEAQGRLGDVPKDDATGRPAYGFAHAERAVALGGRTTRRRFSVVNQKGGVGKTTTVFSLAGAFAEIGRRVLAIDLDAQANLTSSFGYDPDTLELTSENLVTEEEVAPEDVILETGVEGVHLIPADIRLCSVDVKIHEMYMREYILVNKLRRLFDHYHVVLFDCPPNLSKVTINALIASQEVIVPVETQSYSIKAISDLTNTFALLKAKLDHALRAWILPTKVDRRVRLANDFLAALDRHFGAALLDPIGLDANVVKAPMIYEPIVRSFPASRAARDYVRLAKFLALPDAERDAYAPPPDRFARAEEDDLFSDEALRDGDDPPAAPARQQPPGAPSARS
jgi:chromosome partitioning protein